VLAEFEEKQYGQQLNNELLGGSNLIFTPGQFLESYAGFDAALFTRNREFWKKFISKNLWYRRMFRYLPAGAHISELESVPLPTAAWFFGSGLLGLAGTARRKFKAA